MQSIYAILVTYNPNIEELKSNLDKLSQEIKNVIIVDNSDEKNIKSQIIDFLCSVINGINTRYIDNNGNIGLSKAQNIGIKYALENKDCNWILLLDDDSFFGDNSLKNLIEFYNKTNEKEKIGILVANSIDININKGFKYYVNSKEGLKIEQCNENEVKDVLVAMASGSLIKREVFYKIGFFEEEFFIDCIDTEYCLRAKENGYKIKLVGNSILYHKLGDKIKIKIFNKEIAPTNHSAFRCYNIYRNNLILFKKYFKENKKYFIFQILILSNHFLKIIIFENNKVEKLKMILGGLREGFKYKTKRG